MPQRHQGHTKFGRNRLPDDTDTEKTVYDTRDRFRGCLIAGAAGDALGTPVEFWSLSEIRSRLGAQVVTEYLDDPSVSDDARMTLFTAEGLIRVSVRGRSKGVTDVKSAVRNAYLRWLHSQGPLWHRPLSGTAATH